MPILEEAVSGFISITFRRPPFDCVSRLGWRDDTDSAVCVEIRHDRVSCNRREIKD